jgi:hypothetical protein
MSVVWWMDGVTISTTAPFGGDGRVALLRRPGRLVGCHLPTLWQ